MAAPRVAVGLERVPRFVRAAIEAGGGVVADLADADALVWLGFGDPGELRRALDGAPHVRWVQLPSAGVERWVDAGIVDHDRVWTCAKGSYGEAVAEHALALALAGLRELPMRARAHTWGSESGRSLYDGRVTILGGGGIAHALVALLQPLRADVTIVRRQPEPVPGASRTLDPDRLPEALAGADVVVLALALTPETRGIIGGRELAAMDDRAWLVNVARGKHVVTDDLVDALRERTIGGAALDVTDPEPLPDGHPLWSLENCLITPHTADTMEMVRPALGARIEENVRRLGAGEPLVGLVDPVLGY